jgi:very-short-patch-repair endonuclease
MVLMTRVFNRQAEKKRRQSLRNSLSPSEVILWSRLRNREVCAQKFRRQFSVGPYLLDFYCPALRLAIEIDGDSHFQLGEQEKDRTRQQFIEATGIQFLRFRNVEVRENLRGVLEAIYRKIQALNETV